MTVITQDTSQGNSETKSDVPEVIVAEWPINNRGETARISLDLYKGAWRIGCRKWFLDDDGKLCPTRQGISLRVEHLPRLAAAIAKALSAAHERGLIQADREGGQ
jgi:hypothetical protein